MPPQTDTDALKSLEVLVQTASTLLTQLQSVLAEIHKNPTSTPASSGDGDSNAAAPSNPINALALAHDSASLIRAHGTKLSLLIINEPFTPSAISTVIRELVSGPIPGVVSAVQACKPEEYTALVRKELAWRSQRALSELHELLQKVPKDGKVVSESKRGGYGAGAGEKGSLPVTGLLWAACDAVTGLSQMGVGGLFVQKVGQWNDVLNDVMEELKEWGDEEPDDDDDEDDEGEDEAGDGDVNDLADQVENTHVSTQAMLDDLMNSQQTIPRSDPDRIRPRLETSLKRLRLVTLLYQALTKRRLKKLPAFPPSSDSVSTVPSRLDEIAKLLQRLPERFGDLACAFYELLPAEIDAAMDQCFFDAFAASELFSKSWDGSRDEFSDWTDKFQLEIKKV